VGSSDIASTPTIRSNIISGNQGYQGAGIRCHGYQVRSGTAGKIPLIVSNLIIANTAAAYGGGIEITICNGINMAAAIVNNVIVQNTAVDGGAGIRCVNSLSIPIVNNTIVDNDVDENSASILGAGLLVRSIFGDDSASARVMNCIFWHNKSNDAQGQDKWDEIAVVNGGTSADATVVYSDVHGGITYTTGAFADITAFLSACNISSDPLLTQDWRLGSGSLCIDSGACSHTIGTHTLRAPLRDIDSNVRPTNGDGADGEAYDIGAHEYGSSMWRTPADVNDDCRVNVLDLILIRNKLIGSDRCESRNWRLDVNVDGVINVLDLLVTRNLMGTKCPE